MLEDMQIVIPELILDEEGHHGPHRAQEAAGIGNRVQRQIAHDVGTLIVLAHLVARRREERQQDFILRVVAPQLLHQRPSLLKLAERGGMKPYVLGAGVNLLAQNRECLTLATPHLAHLLIEKAVNGNAGKIQIYDYVVHTVPPTAPESLPTLLWRASFG